MQQGLLLMGSQQDGIQPGGRRCGCPKSLPSAMGQRAARPVAPCTQQTLRYSQLHWLWEFVCVGSDDSTTLKLG